MRSENLRLDIDGNTLVARLGGEIDLSNAEQLGKEIAEATPAEVVGVVLDLTDVSYLDSFGIYVVFGLQQHLAHRDHALALVIPHDSPVLATLRLANVLERLTVAETVEEAVHTLVSERSRT